MQTGKIGVTTENIFPIIKKFLYSDHEIFLRELISNAVDATQKLKAMAMAGDFKADLGDLTIRVDVDKKKKIIKVSDRGIGMTQEEVDKYLNQIAFSSANEFLDKYKDQASSIIGHFGLGFYSAFMVSDKVEVITKSWQENSQAVKWTCDGTPEFTIEEVEKTDRGTDVILHIDKDSKEFLEEQKIEELLKKYCKFLPVEIAFGKEKEWKDNKYVDTEKDRIINNTKPAWTLKPS
ncbi:MAG TPA: ATP-binding protein, partial [Bacteroidales bacterium]|nr:ATP-binding protein [Bacteroidales bacterium]